MMESTAMRRPSPGACLDDLLASRFLPRRWAARIFSPGELPGRLERCARNLAAGSEWRAYSEEQSIFFAIARAHRSAGRPDAGTALDVYFLDANASVYSAGVWEYDRDHGWWLDAVLDVSYDCDHGWWLDELMDPNDADGGTSTGTGIALPAPIRAAGSRSLGAPTAKPAAGPVRTQVAAASGQKRPVRPRRVTP